MLANVRPARYRQAMTLYQALQRGDDLPITLAEFLNRPTWMADAACAEHPELDWFPGQGQDGSAAQAVCTSCLVRAECLDYALSEPLIKGTWAGTGPTERQHLRRRAA